MMSIRVFKMWYRLMRQHGMNRREALLTAWALRKPTVKAIDEHGGME